MITPMNKFIQEAKYFNDFILAVGMINFAGQKRKIYGLLEKEIIDNLVVKIHKNIHYQQNVEIIANKFLSSYGKEKCLKAMTH